MRFTIVSLALFFSFPAFASKDLALIFKGPTVCNGCETAAAELAERHGLTPRLVRLGETTPELLSHAAVYIVPGGEDVTSLSQTWSEAERNAIRDYVENGGRYLGFCLGAYWAGDWPGYIRGFQSLGIIPAHVLAHSMSIEDRIEKIIWLGTPHYAYFQDGPAFIVNPAIGVQLFASYASDSTAAVFISRYYEGKVAVSGVHIEAPYSWYRDSRLPDPDGRTGELADMLFSELLEE